MSDVFVCADCLLYEAEKRINMVIQYYPIPQWVTEEVLHYPIPLWVIEEVLHHPVLLWVIKEVLQYPYIPLLVIEEVLHYTYPTVGHEGGFKLPRSYCGL